MPQIAFIQHSFNAGEVSERFESRMDQNKRLAALATSYNLEPHSIGGIKERPGLQYVADCKDTSGNDEKRLVAFKPSSDNPYIIELGHQYMRFFRNGVQLLGTTGSELIVNGDFPTDLSSWTVSVTGAATVAHGASGGGRAVFTATGTDQALLRQDVTTVVGNTYRVSFDVPDDAGGGSATGLIKAHAYRANLISGPLGSFLVAIQQALAPTYKQGGPYDFDFVAAHTSTRIEFFISGDLDNGKSRLDNVSVKLVTGAPPIEITTPWTSSDLAELYLPPIQSVDVAYFLHRKFPPQKLTRTTPTTFTLNPVSFNTPATEEEEPTGEDRGLGTLTPAATTGTGITFTTQNNGLLAADVGRIIIFGASRGVIATVNAPPTNTMTVDILDDFPDTNPISAASWRFKLSPQADLDIQNSRKEVNEVTTITLSAQGFESRMVGKWISVFGGLIQIDKFTSATSMKGTIKAQLKDVTQTNPDATRAWSLEVEAWTPENGFPDSGAFFQNRLWLCKGLTVYGSTTNDFENFAKGGNDDDSIARTISDDDVDKILWTKAVGKLVLGTGSGIFEISPTTENGALTPDSFKVEPILPNKKCARIPPVRVGNLLIYLTLGARRLRELVFDFATDKFRSPNLLLLSDHLTESRSIIELAYAEEPDSIIYCVADDGNLLPLVYQEEESVVGWSRWETNGSFKSVAVIPRPANGKDWVWAIVERNGVRYIEYFEPDHPDTGREWASLQTDSASITTHDGNFLVTGLTRFEGLTVRVIGDGMLFDDAVVTSGQFTLSPQITVSKLEVGLDYQSEGLTLEPFVPPEMGGPFMAKKWDKIGVRLRNTLGIELNGETLPFRRAAHNFDQHVPLQKGKRFVHNLGYDPFARISFKRTKPFPLEILNIVGLLSVGDNWDERSEDQG